MWWTVWSENSICAFEFGTGFLISQLSCKERDSFQICLEGFRQLPKAWGVSAVDLFVQSVTAPLSSFKPSFNQSLSVTGAETKPHEKSAHEASAFESWLSLPEPCLNFCKVNDNMAGFSKSCLNFSGKNFCWNSELNSELWFKFHLVFLKLTLGTFFS